MPDSNEPQQTDRIVEGRPPFYTVKRALHPLTWLEAGIKPPFRSAKEGRINAVLTRKPNPHFQVGVGGAGTGSGFGPSVTLRATNVLGRGIEIEIPLLYTYARYEVYQFKASVPIGSKAFGGRFTFDLGTGYASRAGDGFFGIGNQTPHGADRMSFRSVTRDASTGFTAKFNDTWTAGLHAVYRNVGITDPLSGRSAQDHFDRSIPGLFEGGAFRSAILTIGHDDEKRDDYAFKGGAQLLEVSRNDSAGKGDFSYWQYHFAARQFFPLTSDGRKVIAARALVETNLANGGGTVPFYDMPILGSLQTIRGFENFRFRDNSAVAMTLEYRYRIWRAMDWGLFIDEGQVASQLGDMSLRHFHAGYGARLFVWPRKNLPISFDLGRSRESWRLYVNVNTNF